MQAFFKTIARKGKQNRCRRSDTDFAFPQRAYLLIMLMQSEQMGLPRKSISLSSEPQMAQTG